MTAAGRFVVAALVVAGIGPAIAGERMSGDDLTTALPGITLDGVYPDGTYFTETYHDDRTIRYWDANGADSGQWSIRNGLFCTFYESQEGACFLVERDGDNCFTFFEMQPDEPTVPREQWTSRGWNRAKPATCPTPPQPSI